MVGWGSDVASQYLKKYGHRVLDNGYEIVPITPGTKFPNFNTWRSLSRITHKRVTGWLSNGHARDGIGIRAKFTPMLDIDSLWQPFVDWMATRAEELLGPAPHRIGNAPKVGLIYRSVIPFKKVTSKAFTDPNGNKAQVEFLGDGQQWVAFAIHPDTKKKYHWTDKDYNPLKTEADDLSEVGRDQALELIQEAEQWMIDQGWTRWKSKKQSTALTTVRERDPDDLISGSQLGLSIEEVRDWCERLENDESVEYEGDDFDATVPNYRNVLFAIWHETDGSEEGREIAWDWSEKSPKHEKEEGRFFKLWNSADPEGRDDAITFRYVIKLVLAQEADEKRELRDGYLDSLKDCTDADDLKNLVSVIAKTRFDDIDTERLAHAFKAAMHRITGVSLPIAKARKELYHEPTTEEVPWLKPWRYIRHSMRFYNVETGEELEHKGFDAAFSRYVGGISAVDFAMNKAQIKTYYIQMYKPDDDEEFWFAGNECINTFSERLMPEMPGKYSKKDLLAIAIVEAHIAHVIPDERERGIFISFLAYIVQKRSRPNWAIVLQGVDGDGKSFFGEMMGAVLGSNNVRMLDAQQLEDKYTAWTVGQLFTFIEELRMQGHSRYDILNKIKPYVTNNAVNVHPKNVNPYTALNTTAYFATTNFRDALPLNDNDRRYFVLMSAWQSGDRLRSFLATVPNYFKRLWSTLNRPGAIRQWLMEYELHPEFDPKGRAPLTQARDKMVNLSKSDLQIAFEEIVKEDTHPQISNDLVISAALSKYLFEQTEELMNTNSITKFLSGYGYDNLKFRIRINGDDANKYSVWVKDKSTFSEKDQSRQRRDVIRFLNGRNRRITHENDI
jgi:hypothetical protein